MKQILIIFSLTAFTLVGCTGAGSNQNSDEAELTQEEIQEIMVNDSLTNEMEGQIQSIQAATENLDALLNTLK